MNTFVLDTSILIHLNRGNSTARSVREFVNTYEEPQPFICVVSIAEAESLVVQWKWSEELTKRLRNNIQSFVCIDIEQHRYQLINSYVAIDCYSKRKTAAPQGQLIANGAITMKKNDLWIAATAHALDATLITTDSDFDHLHEVFIKVKKF